MTLAAGSRLGSYEILSAIGAGGMGEVYRARDTRLGREAAIKVLPSSLSENQESLRRFEQEARAASALNHPNIVTVYEVGRADATSYIAMELVEGKTVRELAAAGPLSLKRALSIAAQAADGLAKAHAAGIVTVLTDRHQVRAFWNSLLLAALVGLMGAVEQLLTEASQRFEQDAQSPRAARRFVTQALDAAADDDMTDTITLLVSELVTNAVVHAGSEVEVMVRLTDTAARVEVTAGPLIPTDTAASTTELVHDIEAWFRAPAPGAAFRRAMGRHQP